MKLRNDKDDARILKGESLSVRSQIHSFTISFLCNNLWVFIVTHKRNFQFFKCSLKKLPPKFIPDPLNLQKRSQFDQ